MFGFHTEAAEVVRGIDLTGRRVVITGASSGIGVETARALALVGADLVLGVRDVAKGGEVLRDIDGNLRLLRLDLSDLASVANFAAQISGPVDVLICNAGVSKTPDKHLANGLDIRFATNHLGHFHLAHLLKPQMAERGARIVVVSSAAHKGMPVRLDDLQWQSREHFDGAAYAESKSANILFAQEATRRWQGEGIFANAVLPGSSLTGLQRFHGEALKRKIGFIHEDGSLDPRMKTAGQAAATSVWAATAPELKGRGGLVLEDCAEALPVGPETHAWAGYDASVADPETARLLWEHSLELVRKFLP
ncbi:SDR family NAD(P)-dependent oxidoreductase [Novosphingobium sp. JCM 18896]|uniref:SDR family NAD(P)-dependent oxidoreductase n=1 Tax=Novosphingobium sp. JCM 18896 TaxID=2989731 RepID=UPI002223C9CC|nr:SDR family NAD(P)-dependent oxidoreductase [Novosphingobium sp. JCM 18896]MCW1428209.1 SDR family NAD(P)-dependent oxidoreductase [Novosphingobium sp. JCM 18896]